MFCVCVCKFVTPLYDASFFSKFPFPGGARLCHFAGFTANSHNKPRGESEGSRKEEGEFKKTGDAQKRDKRERERETLSQRVHTRSRSRTVCSKKREIWKKRREKKERCA